MLLKLEQQERNPNKPLSNKPDTDAIERIAKGSLYRMEEMLDQNYPGWRDVSKLEVCTDLLNCRIIIKLVDHEGKAVDLSANNTKL